MHRRPHPVLRHFCLLIVCVSLGCTTPSGGVKKDEAPEGSTQDEAEALLDAPVDQADIEAAKAARRAEIQKEEGADYMIPVASSTEPIMPIDGDPEGWNLKEAKVFKEKRYVEDGVSFWAGSKDASMRVAVRSDDSFVYFWVEARDDVVLSEDDADGDAVDGIVIWLRDPNLERMVSQLPDGTDASSAVDTEVAFVITPDGRLRRFDDADATFDPASLRTRTFETKSGWGVEAAISVEAIGHVAAFPAPKIAFRVELLDGDDPARLGTQTRMSMLPNLKDAADRFAVYSGDGLLPHRTPEGSGGRPGGLGFWSLDGDVWRYTTFEALPEVWRYVTDPSRLEEALKASNEIRDACPDSRFDSYVLDAYRTESGKHYVGLMLCGGREQRGACADGAQTRALWFQAAGKAEGYAIKKIVDAMGGPLEQCRASAPSGKPLYQSLSLTPLDFVSAHTWAVSWRRTSRVDGVAELTDGLHVLSTKRKGIRPLEITAYKQLTEDEFRTVHRSAIHFVEVDDVEGLDICEIERIEEQTCDRGGQCTVDERGREVLTHAKMWSPDEDTFEPYMLTKHPNCRSDTSFVGVEGYLMIHLESRVGLIPSGG
jgi:hypothetical protein